MGENLILAVTPGQAALAAGCGLPLAHLSYRVSGGPHLVRANSPVGPAKDGLMGMDAEKLTEGGDCAAFCNEVLRECAARSFSGAVCRFGSRPTPALGELAAKLDEVFDRRGLSLYVSEACAGAAPHAKVLIPTALSGGSLRARLETALGQCGPGRVALWAERSAEDFLLPSPSGTGAPLTAEELSRRREEHGANVFFSDELCAHYFTYRTGDQAHFVLFDDVGSIRKKLLIGRQLGVETAFLPYGQTADLLGDLLGRDGDRKKA